MDLELGKNKSIRRAASGRQNIKLIQSGYRVTIGAIKIGIFATESEAVERRDAARLKQGMPIADY